MAQYAPELDRTKSWVNERFRLQQNRNNKRKEPQHDSR